MIKDFEIMGSQTLSCDRRFNTTHMLLAFLSATPMHWLRRKTRAFLKALQVWKFKPSCHKKKKAGNPFTKSVAQGKGERVGSYEYFLRDAAFPYAANCVVGVKPDFAFKQRAISFSKHGIITTTTKTRIRRKCQTGQNSCNLAICR